jgi:hypothetical protein
MAGYMRWVRKQNLVFLLAVLVPAIVGVGMLSANTTHPASPNPTVEIISYSKTQCINLTSLLVFTLTDSECPSDSLDLGDAPLTESRTATGDVVEIHPLLSTRFTAAQSFAREDGVILTVTSGYRSFWRQQMLFDREVEIRGSETEAAKWVLPPQFSHHPLGLAIDVNYPYGRSEALWLETNGSRFGLCRVYANEWWHFEGVIAPGGICPALAPNALVDVE